MCVPFDVSKMSLLLTMVCEFMKCDTDGANHLHIYCSRQAREFRRLTAPLITHWGPVTQICVGKLTSIGSDNGLSPGRCQTIIWTNAGIVNWTLRSKLQLDCDEIQTFSLTRIRLRMSSAKWRPIGLSRNVVILTAFELKPRRKHNRW